MSTSEIDSKSRRGFGGRYSISSLLKSIALKIQEPGQGDFEQDSALNQTAEFEDRTRSENGVMIACHEPLGMIAGMCPSISGRPIEASWNAAAVELETERVRMIVREKDGCAWYLAAASSQFTLHPDSGTPLASALPGDEGHRGDGAYLSVSPAGAFGVFVTSGDIACYAGDASALHAEAARRGLAVFDVSSNPASRWVGYNLKQEEHTRNVRKIAVLSGIGVSILSVIVATFGLMAGRSSLPEVDMGVTNAHEELIRSAGEVFSPPVMDARKMMGLFSHISREIQLMNGIISRLEMEGGVVRLEAAIPLNITSDRISRIDPEIKWERVPSEGLIRVRLDKNVR